MKIGTSHRNKIWKGLTDYKNSLIEEVLQRDSNSATTLNSQSSISQTSTYCPGYYEVTRYTFKHTISLTREAKRPRTDEWLEILNNDLCCIKIRFGWYIDAYLCKKQLLQISNRLLFILYSYVEV